VPEVDMEKGISNALSHIDSVSVTLSRIFSVQGVLEIVSAFTFFYIPFVWSAINYKQLFIKMPVYFLLIFPVISCHIMLSAELPRMLLYSFPIVCLFVSYFFELNLVKLGASTTGKE
jgi:hypothetical protein